MVNHIHVHRANVQPLFDYPVLAGQATTLRPSPDPNTGKATGPGQATTTAAGGAAKTDSRPATSLTDNASAAANSATATTADKSSSIDGGLSGGLLSTHVPLDPSASTTSTAGSTSAVTTPTSAAAAHATSKVAGSASVSTIFRTLDPSSSSSSAPPPSTNNPDASPIAGGVIGGLFVIVALAMLVSFLLRRRRRKQINREILGTDIFDGSGYRRSTIFFEDAAKRDRMDSDKLIPRPPSMVERRVGTPALHGDAPYGGYGDSNSYSPQAPGYPPQSMQRGYYSQGQQQPPYFQQPGYNLAYAYGGLQVPSRAHTPQVPGHHHPHQMPSDPGPTHITND